MPGVGWCDVLRGIAVPVLPTWLRGRARSPRSIARHFDQTIRDATLVVILDYGHVSEL
jgi:hypothetical protein